MTIPLQPNIEDRSFSSNNGIYDIFTQSQQGATRKENQDRFLVKPIQPDELIVVLADGMGGEAGGGIAAQMTITDFEGIQHFPKNKEFQFLIDLYSQLDNKILNAGDKNIVLRDMGTTLISLFLKGNTAFWAHAGDSRLYLLRNKKLAQITQDQTFARFLLEEGEITEDEISTHYSKNILDQCVGHGVCEPETGSISLKKDDLLLVSSDGLHKPLENSSIEKILNQNMSLEIISGTLIKKILNQKGNDDITIVLLHVL